MQLKVQGIDVHAVDKGTGVPVLLVHGNPDCSESWRAVIDGLLAHGGFRCVAPDFPGFGRSDEPPPDFDFLPEGQAEYWNWFTATVGIDEPCIAVVHDFGGPWLLPWVAAHPERVRGLVVTNTLFHHAYRWHFWARVWQTPVLGELAMLWTPKWLFRRELAKGDPALPMSHADEAHGWSHRAMRRTVLRTYRAHAQPGQVLGDWPDRLKAAIASMPREVLWGDLDPYLPRWMADDWGVNATHVADAGHWLPVSRPKLVVEAVRRVHDAAAQSGPSASGKVSTSPRAS
ncbi:MAG: alpha/beta fold hydrolase [Pseudomonadota bacterium]